LGAWRPLSRTIRRATRCHRGTTVRPSRRSSTSFARPLTDKSSLQFVPLEERIATFDQDGTTWVEHPIYTQVQFAYDRLTAIAPQHPEWKTTQPFQAVLTGDENALEKFTLKDIEAIVLADPHRDGGRGIPEDRQGLDGHSETSAL
jgi:hypothetical protein